MGRGFAWSLGAVASLALALSAGSCSGGSSGTSGGSDASADGTTTTSCTTDSQCEATVPPTNPLSCATGKCNTVQGSCEYVAKDEDGDGHAAAECRSTTGVPVQAGDDCNDHDPNLYPGHPEPCSTAPDGGTLPGTLCKTGQITCLSNGNESACSGTLVCTNACVNGACADCEPGQTQCVGNGVQTCNASGTWGTATDCTHQQCVSGSCQGVCTEGDKQCSGNGLQTCSSDGTWSSPVACIDQACVSGSCIGQCAPGQAQCVSNGIETCTSNGNWNTPVACGPTATCSGTGGVAQCVGMCEVGTTICGPNNGVQTCSSSGTWGNPVPCIDQTCSGGTCVGSCAPGQSACSGNGVVTCSTGGGWGTPLACVNQTCVGATSSAGLDGGVPSDAAMDAPGDVAIDAPADAMADAADSGSPSQASAACQGVCAPNQLGCNGPQPQACDSSGHWQSSGPACSGATPTCSGGSCVVCVPSSLGCSGSQPQQCNSSGTGWQNVGSACSGSTSVCLNAGCVACSPGAKQCVGQQPQTCSSAGAWQDTGSACTNQTCATGVCSGVCAPGQIGCNGLIPWTCGSTGQQVPGNQTAGKCGATCSAGTSRTCNGYAPACNPSTVYCSTTTGAFPACPAPSDPTWNGLSVGSGCTQPGTVGACALEGTVVCVGTNGATCNAGTGSPDNSWHTSAASNGSWDWNCDGSVEVEYPGVAKGCYLVGSGPPACTGYCSTVNGTTYLSNPSYDIVAPTAACGTATTTMACGFTGCGAPCTEVVAIPSGGEPVQGCH